MEIHLVLTYSSSNQSLHPKSHSFNKLLWALDGSLETPMKQLYMQTSKKQCNHYYGPKNNVTQRCHMLNIHLVLSPHKHRIP